MKLVLTDDLGNEVNLEIDKMIESTVVSQPGMFQHLQRYKCTKYVIGSLTGLLHVPLWSVRLDRSYQGTRTIRGNLIAQVVTHNSR